MNPRSPYPVSAHYPRPQGYAQAQGYTYKGQGQGQGTYQAQPQPIPISPAYPGQTGTSAYAAPPRKPQSRQVLLAGGSMLALAALVITPRLSSTQEQEVEPFACIKQEQVQALISRDQLKQLLAVEPQSPKATVQGVLQQPYCVLSPGKTEAGQPAEREAYPLEFDPQTWLVVLYEGDRYVGYDFRFR